MVDVLDHTYGIIYGNLGYSDEFNEYSYSLSDVIDNTNTEKTYGWLNQPEDREKYVKEV